VNEAQNLPADFASRIHPQESSELGIQLFPFESASRFCQPNSSSGAQRTGDPAGLTIDLPEILTCFIFPGT